MNQNTKTIIFSVIILLLIVALGVSTALLLKEKFATGKLQEEIKNLSQPKDELSEELDVLKNESEELKRSLNEIEKFLEDFEFPCLIKDSKSCEIGDKVLAMWEDGLWYPAKINSMVGSEYKVDYYDGDVGIVSKYEIRKFDWKVGTRVECNWRNWGKYYPGVIASIDQRGETIRINYDDGDREDATISRCRSFSTFRFLE